MDVYCIGNLAVNQGLRNGIQWQPQDNRYIDIPFADANKITRKFKPVELRLSTVESLTRLIFAAEKSHNPTL